jgi:hypothetical protein
MRSQTLKLTKWNVSSITYQKVDSTLIQIGLKRVYCLRVLGLPALRTRVERYNSGGARSSSTPQDDVAQLVREPKGSRSQSPGQYRVVVERLPVNALPPGHVSTKYQQPTRGAPPEAMLSQ